MRRRKRIKQITSMLDRLSEHAQSLRSDAKALPKGARQAELLHKAKQFEAAMQMDGWLKRSPQDI